MENSEQDDKGTLDYVNDNVQGVEGIESNIKDG